MSTGRTTRIELTTCLAVAAAGLLTFAVYAAVVAAGSGFRTTLGDRPLHDLAHDTYGSGLKHVAEAITAFGSLPAVGLFVLVASGILAWRRRGLELLVLLAGFVLVYAAVSVTKGAIGRPRPPDRLVSTSGSAYPSGHAAYATAYVVLAVIAARVVGTRASRAALVTAGLVAAIAIGATRIYLRVHWWSDVAGGWGLGLGIFATLASAALVVDYVRHNWRTDVGGD
jgi:membrane-associated phospholipid phosphatase